VWVTGMGSPVPNPCRIAVSLPFIVAPGDEHGVAVEVYDLCGRIVRTLVDGDAGIGSQTAIWDLTDARGAQVPDGIYFLRLRGPGVSAIAPLVVLR
ncbi:hypothetical protein JW921_01135, partial [Candidatus Fermentibacterales bacterium]|nr:hypothetical protein [Candidatus Fermentibacterales bacterium]